MGIVILVATVAIAVVVLVLGLTAGKTRHHRHSAKSKKTHSTNFAVRANEEVDELFTEEFRNELRNRGILRFEHIIAESATSLKHDITSTVTQLNEYTKKEVGSKLNEELTTYNKALQSAQQITLQSLEKSAAAFDGQQHAMTTALTQKVAERQAALIKAYEENMAKIIAHYLTEALGEQFDFKAQLPYIITQMEANKEAIIQDMQL